MFLISRLCKYTYIYIYRYDFLKKKCNSWKKNLPQISSFSTGAYKLCKNWAFKPIVLQITVWWIHSFSLGCLSLLFSILVSGDNNSACFYIPKILPRQRLTSLQAISAPTAWWLSLNQEAMSRFLWEENIVTCSSSFNTVQLQWCRLKAVTSEGLTASLSQGISYSFLLFCLKLIVNHSPETPLVSVPSSWETRLLSHHFQTDAHMLVMLPLTVS